MHKYSFTKLNFKKKTVGRRTFDGHLERRSFEFKQSRQRPYLALKKVRLVESHIISSMVCLYRHWFSSTRLEVHAIFVWHWT